MRWYRVSPLRGSPSVRSWPLLFALWPAQLLLYLQHELASCALSPTSMAATPARNTMPTKALARSVSSSHGSPRAVRVTCHSFNDDNGIVFRVAHHRSPAAPVPRVPGSPVDARPDPQEELSRHHRSPRIAPRCNATPSTTMATDEHHEPTRAPPGLGERRWFPWRFRLLRRTWGLRGGTRLCHSGTP